MHPATSASAANSVMIRLVRLPPNSGAANPMRIIVIAVLNQPYTERAGAQALGGLRRGDEVLHDDHRPADGNCGQAGCEFLGRRAVSGR